MDVDFEENLNTDGARIEVNLNEDESLQVRIEEGKSDFKPKSDINLVVEEQIQIESMSKPKQIVQSAKEPRKSIVKGCLNVRKNSTVRRGSNEEQLLNMNKLKESRRASQSAKTSQIIEGEFDIVKVFHPAAGKKIIAVVAPVIDKAQPKPVKKETEPKMEGMSGLNAQQIKAFKEVFDLFDRNGGGTIDADDLEGSLKSVGIELSKAEIYDLLQTLDMDGTGDIDFKEFLHLMTSTERFLEMLTCGNGNKESNRQNYHYLLFEALTGFMKECALKNMHTIVGYYQKKYTTSKMTHVVNHYAAGTRLIGLTEKQLKLHLENLKKEASHRGSKNRSPYAEPLHIVMSNAKLPVNGSCQSANSQKKTGRIRLRVRRAERTAKQQMQRKLSGKCSAAHEVGWVSQRTEHIEVKLQPYYLRNLRPFDALTAEDLPRIRAQVNSATKEYCQQRRHTQVHDGIEHWHALEPELISPKSLRNNFRDVFSTYTDISKKYLPLTA